MVGHDGSVFDAVFDPSGSRIATTSGDGTVRVWNAADGQLAITFDVEGTPLVPAFSNDGSLLAATSLEGPVRVWDLETERETRVLAPPDGLTINLAFSPDDSLLAVTRIALPNDDLSPLIFDIDTGLITTLEAHRARGIGFTPDGSRILTAGDDGTVRIWDSESGEEVGAYTGHRGPVSDLQISADGSTVASSGALDVKVWDLISFETRAEVFGHSGDVWAIDLNPTADLLLTATKSDGTTRLWDLSPYWSHEQLGLPNPPGLGAVEFSPVDGTLVTSGARGAVSVWDVDTGQEQRKFGAAEDVSRLDIDPSGTFLAAAGSTGAELLDLSSGGAIATLVSGVETQDVDFGAQGMLATASIDGVRLWESHTGPGEVISEPFGISVAFDPAGTLLAMGLAEGALQGWVEIRDLGSGETIATLTEHSANLVRGLAFDRAGDLMATASDDSTAILWDATSFEPLHRLEGHAAAVLNVAFDPSRREAATASADGTVKIWDVDTGLLRLTLPAQQWLTDIAYSPDGRYLAATGLDGFVTVYILDLDELVSEARSRLTRWWSESECLQYLQTEECPPIPEGLHQ
jgi:WD40 repeat protein